LEALADSLVWLTLGGLLLVVVGNLLAVIAELRRSRS
jgi:hypothetical protein